MKTSNIYFTFAFIFAVFCVSMFNYGIEVLIFDASKQSNQWGQVRYNELIISFISFLAVIFFLGSSILARIDEKEIKAK